MKWVRAKDGAIFGVCKGVAHALDIPVGICRLMWIISILFMGAGFWLYFLLAITLPREDKVVQALEPWVLGVCSKIALRTQMEIGVVRFLAVCLALLSMGASIVGYIVLYFVLEEKKSQTSESRPSAPPATT